jgi:D-glycerate 3-kinase
MYAITMYDTFLAEHQLSPSYIESAQQWFNPIINDLIKHTNSATPLFVSINGSQGSGKTTLASYLQYTLIHKHNKRVVVMSIDDFYYDQQTRLQLSNSVHPLLKTRGVPGTHNLKLWQSIMNALTLGQHCRIPKFNKAADNPYPQEQWHTITGKVDIVIIEGWCMQIPPQLDEMLTPAVNQLEQQQDPDLVWRRFVNNALGEYQPLFQRFHYQIMLKAPSFSVVHAWRLEQEQKLAQRTSDIADHALGIMNEKQIADFIAHYQRLTEHALQVLPPLCDLVFTLDMQRQIKSVQRNQVSFITQQALPLIFTDLDGTLMDHYNYSSTAAYPALNYCHELEIPIIPTTSKTFAELLVIRQQLNLDGPFIVENGAAVYIPKHITLSLKGRCEDKGHYWCYSLAPKRAKWLAIVDQLNTEFHGEFTHFEAMTTLALTAATGLTFPAAKLAKQREYGEPILWLGTSERREAFITRATELGARPVSGGRFIHITGESDKATAMQWLLDQYRRHFVGKEFLSIALGDGPNDISMLEQADFACQVRSPTHPFPPLQRALSAPTYQTKLVGPAGWNEYITTYILKITEEIQHG